MKTDAKGIIIPDYLIVMKWLSSGGKCMSDLQRELSITYKHLHELKHTFIKKKWITIVKDERRHNMFLTNKGKTIVGIANTLLSAMGITETMILKYIKDAKLKKVEVVDVKQILKDVEEETNA